MVSHGVHCQRKRPLEQSSQVEGEQPPTAKRRKADASNCYPPRFWDTLSTVRLTRRALKEFDRRTVLIATAPVAKATATPATRRLLRSDFRRLRQLASGGGPDLSAVRGYSDLSPTKITMSQSSSQARKRSLTSSRPKSSTTGKTKSTTPYSGEFEQKLIDQGVYPDGYEDLDGNPASEAQNLEAIRRSLAQARASLGPSQFSETAFTQFKRENRRAKTESKAMANVIPVIAGSKDQKYDSAGDVAFSRLEKFDPDLCAPKPDTYYGAKPVQIDRRVRRDLAPYIEPSGRTSLPAAPNYFLEGKSASGKPDVAQRQAMYDGAVGARGMLQLQNYGNPTLVYDGNAYTLASTYHPGTGTLQMYATHPRLSAGGAGGAEYYTNQLGAYAMTHSPEIFRNGAAAYRNAREWTQQQRDHFIANANSVAQRMSTDTRTASRTDSNLNASSVVEDESSESDTSADELAPEYDTNAKRLRRPTHLH
ncbi:hypothetical protein LTR66_011094 [Elasticomyces elasticus]|nr:hypothetical protein LTR66_011094 [Elasticomyces elasticus]KAK4980807.1 hypothetical protein LTR28_000790 [Elasticomyces elasticus]